MSSNTASELIERVERMLDAHFPHEALPVAYADLRELIRLSRLTVDEEVIARAICAAVDDPSCFAGDADIIRCFGPHARAALSAIQDVAK